MANTYTPQSIGITPPKEGFKEGGWYGGRQYWGGTLSDPGVIHPSSNQQGAGQAVSKEVNAQSAAAQGKSPQEIETYLDKQRKQSASVVPAATYTPGLGQVQQPGGTGIPGGAGLATPQTLDLTNLYNQSYKDAGIADLEAELAEKERQYTETRGKNSDNPFLSEGTRVGREAKLAKLFDERTANIRNEIAMKKADVETKLNLSLKQFDINSQAAQQSLQQFNTLLSLGALTNASGEDIAQLTMTTGIPSSMIQSAIKASQQKDRQTQVITSTNDAGVVTATVIDTQTGEIVSKQDLGAIGNAQTGGGSATSNKKNLEQQFIADAESSSGKDAGGQHVGVFPQLVAKYAPYMSLDEIYLLYLNTSVGKAYGSPKENAGEVKELYDYYRGTL